MLYYGEPTTKNVYLDVFGTDPNAPKGWRTARKCRMTDGNGNEVLEGDFTKVMREYIIKDYTNKGYNVIVTEHKKPKVKNSLGVDFQAALNEINKVMNKELKGGGK